MYVCNVTAFLHSHRHLPTLSDAAQTAIEGHLTTRKKVKRRTRALTHWSAHCHRTANLIKIESDILSSHFFSPDNQPVRQGHSWGGYLWPSSKELILEIKFMFIFHFTGRIYVILVHFHYFSRNYEGENYCQNCVRMVKAQYIFPTLLMSTIGLPFNFKMKIYNSISKCKPLVKFCSQRL